MDLSNRLGSSLASALERKGYTALTAVQEAVLDPALEGRDLRISSQTGSGKTLAIGFVIRSVVGADSTDESSEKPAGPRALVITPTRELAHQVQNELTWLYQGTAAKVISVTGGGSYRDEMRALHRGPAVIVGTPGRLLDHLKKGSFDPSGLKAVVLDEADRMLDLGFREDLEAIFGFTPNERQTHLCSATFPHDVRALADRVQKKPAHVQGTRLGAANADIEHVIHLVHANQKVDAIINLLLARPDEQTLVFARTRADVADITQELVQAGFRASSLSGEMEQRARNHTLASFKRGDVRVVVATDVAARGIDVQDIARVIHADPPTDSDSYTHRSGRTGRAGRKGTSALLVAPAQIVQATRILRNIGVPHRTEAIPTADEIRRARDERVFEELTAEAETDGLSDPRVERLASRLAKSPDVARVLSRLLTRSRYIGETEPRDVQPIAPPVGRYERRNDSRDSRGGGRYESRDSRGGARPEFRDSRGRSREESRPARSSARHAENSGDAFTPFKVSWGGKDGADPRRLLAIICRRGRVQSSDIGAIKIERSFSIVQVKNGVVPTFKEAVNQPDKRDPGIRIEVSTRGDHVPTTNARDERARGPQGSTRAAPQGGDRPPSRFKKGPRGHHPAESRGRLGKDKRR